MLLLCSLLDVRVSPMDARSSSKINSRPFDDASAVGGDGWGRAGRVERQPAIRPPSVRDGRLASRQTRPGRDPVPTDARRLASFFPQCHPVHFHDLRVSCFMPAGRLFSVFLSTTAAKRAAFFACKLQMI